MKRWKISKPISIITCLALMISFFSIIPQNKIAAVNVPNLDLNVSGTPDFTKTYGGDIDSTTLKFKNPVTATLTYNINPSGTLNLPPKSADVMLVFDISSSMSGTKLTNAKEAAKNFVDSLYNKTGGARDKIGIVAFGTRGYLVKDMTQLTNSTNVTSVKSSIDNLTALSSANGKTNLHEGLLIAKNKIGAEESTKDKYVIVVTDSVPDRYSNTATISGYKNSTISGTSGFKYIDKPSTTIKIGAASSEQKPKDVINSMKNDDNILTDVIALKDGTDAAADTALDHYINTVTCNHKTIESDMNEINDDLLYYSTDIGGNDTCINDLTITQNIPDGCEVDETSLPTGWTVDHNTNILTGQIDKIYYNDRAPSPITKQINIKINTPGVFKFSANISYTDTSGNKKSSVTDPTKLINFQTIKVFPKIKVLYVHGSGQPEEITNTSDTQHRIDVDSMSIQRFISQTLMDINGNYDIIYFGKGVYFGANDKRNTGEQVPGYNFANNKLLDTVISGANEKDPIIDNGLSIMNGNPSTTTPTDQWTISPYDITNKMAEKVKEFIDSNQPVIFNNDTLENDNTNFYSNFHLLDFQDNDLSKYNTSKKNVWRVDSLNTDASDLISRFEKINYHKPYAYLESKPITDPTNYMSNITNNTQNNFMYTPSNNLLKYKVIAYNFNNDDPLSVKLYLDKNADGKYTDGTNGTKNEKVQTWNLYSGAEQQFVYPMPDEYMGRQFWKLSVSDSENQQDNYTDSFLFRGSKMIKMRVLQILPDTSAAAKSSNLRALFQKKADTGDVNYIGMVPDMFEIDVDPIYASDFNSDGKNVLDSSNNSVNYAENWEDKAVDQFGNTTSDISKRVVFTDSAKQRLANGYYDMLIVGFDDTYAKGFLFNDDTLGIIKSYIADGRPVMFSHDNFEGDNVKNQDIRNTFLEMAGQKWQSTKYAYKGQGFWSDPYRGIFKKQIPSTVGINDVSSTYVKNINQGVITTFPYMLSNWDAKNYNAINAHNTINISNTHIQYYRLNLENADPWYNMYGGQYVDSDDSVNSYYTYSYGTITFSGTGHAPSGFLGASQELQLFANTVFKTYNGGNHAPGVVIESPTSDQKVPCSDTKLHNVKATVSDYDGDSTEPLYVKVWADRKDTTSSTPSTIDSDWDDVTPGSDDKIVDTNDDGVADSKPLGIKDGYIKIPNGSRIIFDVDKGLGTMPDSMESRNFFLKFKVKDSELAADDNNLNHFTTKNVKVVDNNGPMLKIVADSTATVPMNSTHEFSLTADPSGTYRIPNSKPNVMNSINVNATIWKKDAAGVLIPTTSSDVEISPSSDTHYDVTSGTATAGTIGNPTGASTLAAQIQRNESVIFEPDPVGVYSSNKEKPSETSLSSNFKIKFKNKGIYVIKYQPCYDLGSDASITPGLPWGLMDIPTTHVKQDVDAQDTTVTVTSSLDNISLKCSNPVAKAGTDTSLALKFKFGFNATDVKLYFDEVDDGSLDSDFSINNDSASLKGFNNGVSMSGVSAIGKCISIGNVTANGSADTDIYDIRFNAAMTLKSGKTQANDSIRFSALEYTDASGTHKISLTDLNTGTNDLKDQLYLPNYKYNATTQAIDKIDGTTLTVNAVPIVVYAKIRLG